MIDLEQLELFVSIAELGSLSKASARCDLGPSALSRRLAALEAQYNGQLLHRNGRGVKLTPLGERMLPLARALLAQARALDDEMTESATVYRGTVHVGCISALVSPVLTEVVRVARERHPELVIHATEGFPNQIEQWLVDGKVDLGFVLRTEPEASERPLTVASLCLIGPPQARVTVRKEIEFKALDGLPLLQPAAPSTFRASFAETAKRLGVRLNIVAEVDSVHLMKEMVAAGIGYGLMSKTAVLKELRAGELTAAPIVNPQIVRFMYLGMSARKSENRAAREVAQLIREIARTMAQKGSWGSEAPSA